MRSAGVVVLAKPPYLFPRSVTAASADEHTETTEARAKKNELRIKSVLIAIAKTCVFSLRWAGLLASRLEFPKNSSYAPAACTPVVSSAGGGLLFAGLVLARIRNASCVRRRAAVDNLRPTLRLIPLPPRFGMGRFAPPRCPWRPPVGPRRARNPKVLGPSRIAMVT
jgi:hypothetical protein